jgi:hypothetical protein
MGVVRIEAYSLKYASAELKRDKEVVMSAVTRWGLALKFADESLRADKDVVMAAGRHSGSVALKYAAEELKSDPDVAALLAIPPEPPSP